MEFGRDFDTRDVRPHMAVYRNDSPAMEKELRRTFTDRDMAKRLPVKMVLSGEIGGPLSLTISDYSGHKVQVTGDTNLEAARNAETANSGRESSNSGREASDKLRAVAQKELGGLSATAYRLDNLSVSVAPNAFIAGKMLRTLRQKAVEAFDNERCKWHELAPNAIAGRALLNRVKFGTDFASRKTTENATISVLVRNPEQIQALKGLPIDSVVMDFDWGVKYDEPLEQIRELGFKAGMATLRIHKPGENHYLKKFSSSLPTSRSFATWARSRFSATAASRLPATTA